MAYEIRLRMIEQNKLTHAMHMYNHITKLCAKFGMGNFIEIELLDSSYTTYARYAAASVLSTSLKKEFEDHVSTAAQSVQHAFNPNDDDKVN